MHGIVACETLYPEVADLAPDAAVRYLPHDLHEFPIHVGDDREIGPHVESAIAELEAEGVSSIRLAFAGTTGLAGVRTEDVPLGVSLADDCISQFRYDADTTATGEVKEAGVYYLTRGTIDRAPDVYKLYLAFQGRADELTARFGEAERTHPDLTIDWAESRLYERARDRGAGMSSDSVDRFFASLLGYFDAVELVDTGSLYDVHEWYAGEVRDFLASLPTENAGNRSVDCRIAAGDRGLLRELFASEDLPRESAYVARYEPGEPVLEE
jgi:hypothetical protein